MTSKQHAVLWMGITLIAVRMFTSHQWGDIWGGLSKGSVLPTVNIPFNNLIHKALTPSEVAINTGKTAVDTITHAFRPRKPEGSTNTGLANPNITGR